MPNNNFQNVLETAEIHDTVCICKEMFGNEKSADGWFTSFQNFGRWPEHSFFKTRNEAGVGLAYNNMQSSDRMDYAFHAMSVGVRFFAPITNLEKKPQLGGDWITNEYISHFFQGDLPNHCSFTLRIGQDDQIDLNGMMMPPGYGPTGGAASLGLDDTTILASNGIPFSGPQSVFVGTQGVPAKENRYSLYTQVVDEKTGQKIASPLEIPRNETIEIKMKLSEYAQNVLSNSDGPQNYGFGKYEFVGDPGTWTEDPVLFSVRYGIQVSLYGVREIQQRGEYHAV
jgi:hypothetical protein